MKAEKEELLHRWEALHPLERLLPKIQRFGVLACLLLMGLGMLKGAVSTRARARASTHSFAELVAERSANESLLPRTGAEIRGAFSNPKGWLVLGLVLLIFLPVIRVGILLVVFLLQRDFLYVAMTTLVFLVLLAGVFSASLPHSHLAPYSP